jgi:hypothetical protein
MPVLETKGAISAQGYGLTLGASVVPNYIEDVFSTWLYTGNGTTQTITNGIDLSGRGGLVWSKIRSTSGNNQLFDTTRGMTFSSAPVIVTNTPNQEFPFVNAIRADASGFSLGTDSALYSVNTNAATYASWTFQEKEKFFDIVTWTGTGSAINVPHNLGSVPGCIIVKSLDDSSAGTWYVYHRGNGLTGGVPVGLSIDTNSAAIVFQNPPANITATVFNTDSILNDGAGRPIASGARFVAYLFAHDAGGFGLTGTDNVISCGRYTGNGSSNGTLVTLGYEPQWLMIKNVSNAGNLQVVDNMRGMPVGSADATLQANQNASEVFVDYVSPTSTGFRLASPNTEVNGGSQI